MASSVLDDVSSTALPTPRKVVEFRGKVWQPAWAYLNQAIVRLIFSFTPIFPIGPVEIRTVSKVECSSAFHELRKRQAYFNTEVNPKCTVQDFPVRSCRASELQGFALVRPLIGFVP